MLYHYVMEKFDIPVCLIIFKRIDTTLRIIERLSIIKPSKIYLLGDQGRTEEEKELVKRCRDKVEKAICWECEVIKYYASENRGVYENIAGGAKFVFSKEDQAIFLEDDNLPDITFFSYCKNLLQKYKDCDEVLWICGTNYLEKTEFDKNSDYYFTRHLLPCGWASWSKKFLTYYDGDLTNFDNQQTKNKLKRNYLSKRLFKQQYYCFKREFHRKINGQKFISWDYQMAFSIRYFNKYGISPKYNLIENIGVDNYSEHGGNSFKKEMTKRFCGVKTHNMPSEMCHPTKIKINLAYEKKINKIITNPFSIRIKHYAKIILFKLLGLDTTLTYREGLNKIKHRSQ